jgi:hypothetical protein
MGYFVQVPNRVVMQEACRVAQCHPMHTRSAEPSYDLLTSGLGWPSGDFKTVRPTISLETRKAPRNLSALKHGRDPARWLIAGCGL